MLDEKKYYLQQFYPIMVMITKSFYAHYILILCTTYRDLFCWICKQYFPENWHLKRKIFVFFTGFSCKKEYIIWSSHYEANIRIEWKINSYNGFDIFRKFFRTIISHKISIECWISSRNVAVGFPTGFAVQQGVSQKLTEG